LSAWRELEPQEYAAVWDRFFEKFQFNPRTPLGIIEPAASVTFDIRHVYDRGAEAYESLTADLEAKLRDAFRRCVDAGETMYALDWQHECYLFDPHREVDVESDDAWPIPALPDGDYHIFLSRNLESGIFGHPWEYTMCVFGRSLIDALESNPPELFTKAVRVAGRA
jgi:hypothetical protein